MTHISASYAEIINLMHTSKWHKKNCMDSDCHVSLHQLRQTANRLLQYVAVNELVEAKQVVDQMDVT